MTRAGSVVASRKSSVSADSPTIAWLANWAVDRSFLRADVKSFKQHMRPFIITPPSNSRQGSATTEEIPRTMASNSGAQQDNNNFQDSGFSERQYRAMQAMITAALARPQAGAAPPDQSEPNLHQQDALPAHHSLRTDDIGFFNPNAKGEGPVVGEKYVIF